MYFLAVLTVNKLIDEGIHLFINVGFMNDFVSVLDAAKWS